MTLHSKDIPDIKIWFTNYHKLLCNVSYAVVKDKEVAADIVQSVFLEIWKNRKEIQIRKTVKGYLIRSTVYASLKYLKENRRKILLEQELKRQPEKSAINDSEVSIRLNELEDKINQALFRLPTKCRTIFILSRYEGMKYKEIADHMGISIKTVENQMSIALERMRKDLKSIVEAGFIHSVSLISLYQWLAG